MMKDEKLKKRVADMLHNDKCGVGEAGELANDSDSVSDDTLEDIVTMVKATMYRFKQVECAFGLDEVATRVDDVTARMFRCELMEFYDRLSDFWNEVK